jgi:hypothetical protein
MEAMWINFESLNKKRFAVRLFLGGVNGISGEVAIGDMTSLIRRMNSLASKQDYIVLPDQKWLDGIATSPGIVKQFVTTKTVSPRQKSSHRCPANVKSRKSHPGAHKNEEDEDNPTRATIEWHSVSNRRVVVVVAHSPACLSRGSNYGPPIGRSACYGPSPVQKFPTSHKLTSSILNSDDYDIWLTNPGKVSWISQPYIIIIAVQNGRSKFM